MSDVRYRTDHKLHVNVSFMTGGLWLLPYAAITVANARGRRALARQEQAPAAVEAPALVAA